MTERVRLVLPASGEYTRVARAATAVLARRERMSVRELDQLQLEVGARVTSVAEQAVESARIELVFAVGDGAVQVKVAEAGQPV